VPVSKVTVGSAVSVQAVKPAEAVPPVGELPTRRAQRRDVPVTPAQDDKLFVRESIGSATVEKRLDLDIPDSGLALSACRNESGVQMGLSVDRPVVLAALDVFSRFADNETIKKSIDQNLQLTEFENELLKADYDFLMNSLKSQNPQLVQDLQDSLNSEETSLEEKLRILSEISSKSEEVSRRLDFVRPENGFSTKIQGVIDASLYRFEESQPASRASEIIGTTSTATIKNLQDVINDVIITRADNDLYLRLKTDGTALSDVATTSSRYPGQSYDLLSPIQRFFVCCKMISKIMARTFSLAKFGSLQSVKMPLSLSTPNEAFVFESNNSNTNGDSLVENNFDSIILPAVKGNDQIIIMLSKLREEYIKSKDIFKFRRAVGFEQESCSPQDIALMAFKIIADSFPTYISSLDRSSSPDAGEMTDALLMTFGIRRFNSQNESTSNNISALFRAIMLASIVDPEYKFGDSEPEIFELVSELKSEVDSNGETSTIKAAIGVNSKENSAVSNATSNSSLYSSITKRVQIAPISREWALDYFSSIDKKRIEFASNTDSSEYAITSNDIYAFADVFYYDRLRKTGLLPQPNGNLDLSYSVKTDSAYYLGNVVSSIEDSLELVQTLPTMRGIYDALRNFGSLDKSTCGTSVIKMYSSIVEKFKSVYQIEELDDSKFQYDGSFEPSKNVILDLLFECLSNCILGIANFTIYERAIDDIPKYEYYISSLHVSKCEITAADRRAPDRLSQVEFDQTESIRLLKHVSDLASSRGDFTNFVLASLSRGRQRFTEFVERRFVESASENIYDTIRDLSGSDFLKILGEINTGIIVELVDYSNLSLKFSALQTISEIVGESVSDINRLSSEAKSFRDSLKDLSSDQKADVFKCLSNISTTSALLKNRNRRIASTGNFESAYERDTPGLDASAVRWFFRNRTFADYEKSRLVFFGLPQGFTSALMRQTRDLDPETFEMTGEDPVPNTTPAYFESSLTSRPIQSSSIVHEYRLMKFHPLIHVVQKEKILANDSFVEITAPARRGLRDSARSTSLPVKEGLYNRFSIFVFQSETGGFGLPLSIDNVEFKSAVNKLGLSVDAAVEIVQSHILDSIHKSVVRTLTGLQIDADTLGTYGRAMSVSDAGSVLQLMSADTAGVIPRGSMSAINFLNRTEDGFIELIPYSRLRGRSSDKTNPSDHALLMKFLNTRAFTKGTLSREVLLPSAFERVYCGIFNPADSDLAGSPAENLNISQITIKAIRL